MTDAENTAADTDEQAGRLMELNDRDFEYLLVSHIRPTKRDARQWEAFTSPQVIERTKLVLDALRMRVQGTLERKKIERAEFQNACYAMGEEGKRRWYTGAVEMDRTRRNATHFLSIVEHAQKDVRQQVKQVRQKKSLEEFVKTHGKQNSDRQNSVRLMRKLVAAIIKHDMNCKYPDKNDEQLWDILDQLTVGEDGTTLREAHESGWTD